jgi:hypothetical protein
MHKISLIDFLKDELDRRFGVSISYSGSAVIYTEEKREKNRDWWFEAPKAKECVYLHANYTSNQDIRFLSKDHLERVLRLNSKQTFMNNTWVGYHEQTRGLRIYLSSSITEVTVKKLRNMIDRIAAIRTRLEVEEEQYRLAPNLAVGSSSLYLLG